MRRRALTGFAVALLTVGGGCTSRRPTNATLVPPRVATEPSRNSTAEIEAALSRSKEGTPYLTMLSDEETRKAMPSIFKRGGAPYLIRVGGLQPRTMEAVMAMARQMRTEGGLGDELLNDVFWVVSRVNECLY